MTRAGGRVLLLLAMVVILAIVLAIAAPREGPEPLPARPPAKRPTLLLLTSLPLVFGEDFSVTQSGSPALEALESRYRVVPISTAATAELAKGKLLLMAQPLGQSPEDLIALDDWVRRGGRVLLLADPMLEWPSTRPLGDPQRPPPTFTDTGLLGHWSLRLDGDAPGRKKEKLGGFDVVTVSPGRLSGRCAIAADGLVARCRIGKGRATVVADADLLDVQQLGVDAKHNLDGVLAELAQLEHR